MAESAAGTLPSLEEMRNWTGHRLDDLTGSSVARVQWVYVDAEAGDPVWLVVKLGRFGRTTAIPAADCAAAAGHVWCAHERDRIRAAPAIEPGEPLVREQELELCEHWGLTGTDARGPAVAARKAETQTAVSAPTGE